MWRQSSITRDIAGMVPLLITPEGLETLETHDLALAVRVGPRDILSSRKGQNAAWHLLEPSAQLLDNLH